MITIKEHKKNNKSVFKKTYFDSKGNIIFEKTIIYRIYKIKNNGIYTFAIYDDNMELISSVYRYINIEMEDLSYNSREKSIYALRLLYCFLEFTKKKIESLNQKDIKNLKYFLLGYSPEKGNLSMQLKTIRSNATVNGYLHIYRSYFEYLNIKCDYIFKTKIINIYDHSITGETKKINAYKSNLKTGTPENKVPKYISVDDFSKILKIIRENNNKMGECIIRLMYQFGLRLGEILGMTFEDLTEIEINKKLYPVIYIKNRLSDKHFQKSKSCMNITHKNQYKGKNYKTENLGYQKIIITYDIYELLNNYIDIFHQKARNNHLKRYTDSVIADKTIQNKFDNNYYIFINSIGKVLSQQVWNKNIKKIFSEAGIIIDKEYKKTNLNHRFRHGFAMFHVKYRNTPLLELQKLMRHSSISSTMIYYNPTKEDEAKIKNEFVNELYDLIPELRESYEYEN